MCSASRGRSSRWVWDHVTGGAQLKGGTGVRTPSRRGSRLVLNPRLPTGALLCPGRQVQMLGNIFGRHTGWVPLASRVSHPKCPSGEDEKPSSVRTVFPAIQSKKRIGFYLVAQAVPRSNELSFTNQFSSCFLTQGAWDLAEICFTLFHFIKKLEKK